MVVDEVNGNQYAGSVGRAPSRLRVWSVERVVAQVRALNRMGKLASASSLRSNGHSALVKAAQRHVGSWRQALLLAGIKQEPDLKWTRDTVVNEIRRLHRAGKSTSAAQVPAALVKAAFRQFGAWSKARSIALRSVAPLHPQWTKERVHDELVKLHARGISLSATELTRLGHSRLITAAVRLCGSWSNACRRAIAHNWTPERVIAALKRVSPNGEMPATADVGKTLYTVAVALFGTFERACRRAGLKSAIDRSLREAVDDFQRQYIIRALRECNGNIQASADALRMQRQALQRKMRRLRISAANSMMLMT